MQHSSTPWWLKENYLNEAAISIEMVEHGGPRGIALVKAWPDGRTDPGWGLNPPKNSNEGFMPRYLRDDFDKRRVLYGFDRNKWNFAIVMRSVRLLCVDIDGKNGGIEHAKRLMLPPTLAETSKSGDGYHLFYAMPWETWDADHGFGSLADRIGFEQGVDIRVTGCVYHHPQQRWNTRQAATLPAHIVDQLTARSQKAAATQARIVSVLTGDDQLEVLMLKDEIEARLAKPIPIGKRNNSLFAIGSEMCQAQVEDWEDKLETRALGLGLDQAEIDKLIANIQRYAVPVSP